MHHQLFNRLHCNAVKRKLCPRSPWVPAAGKVINWRYKFMTLYGRQRVECMIKPEMDRSSPSATRPLPQAIKTFRQSGELQLRKYIKVSACVRARVVCLFVVVCPVIMFIVMVFVLCNKYYINHENNLYGYIYSIQRTELLTRFP